MRRLPLPRGRTLAAWIAATLAVAAAGGALVIWSGVYNVAARSGHFAVTEWLLETALRRSVKLRSPGAAARALDDPDLVRLGAGHFAGGCAPCHGAPGVRRSPIVRNMLPAPPPLAEAMSRWSAGDLFWIVRNGLKYTGMPAWAAHQRDDEVWAVVAFLRKLAGMSAAEYRALAAGNAKPPDVSAEDTAARGGARLALTACARCHDRPNAPPPSGLVPALAGQSAAYLARALREYAAGARQSGVMQPVANELGEAEIRNLAAYYSRLSRTRARAPVGRPASALKEQVRRGRAIVMQGIPERGVPACLACHSGHASASFPVLYGQPAPYLSQQLELFRDGVRDETTHGAIMSVVARRLTEQDIADAAAYFQSMPSQAARSSYP